MFADIEAASLPAGMEAVVSAQTQTIAADSGTTCYISATPQRAACFGGNESGVVSSEQILPEPDPAGSNSTNYQAAYVPHWPQALEGDAVTQLSLHRGTGCATHRSARWCAGATATAAQLRPRPWSRAFESARTSRFKMSIHRIGRCAALGVGPLS